LLIATANIENQLGQMQPIMGQTGQLINLIQSGHQPTPADFTIVNNTIQSLTVMNNNVENMVNAFIDQWLGAQGGG